MGDLTAQAPLPVAVIGANGYLGRACLAEARRRDLPAIAVARGRPDPAWDADACVTPLRLDTSVQGSAKTLSEALPERCAIVMAAGPMDGDPEALVTQTLQLVATGYTAAQEGQRRYVLISSIAVYDTDRLSPGDALDEQSPLQPLPDTPFTDTRSILMHMRDPYSGAKRASERALLSRIETSPQPNKDVWILRPGAIWGPGCTWHALQGFWASKLHVTLGSQGELPLAHVDTVARGAIDAALTPTNRVLAINLLDDDRPTRARFLAVHRQHLGWPRLNVTVPFGLWLRLVRLLKPLAHRLPGLFREPVLRARMLPLTFPNAAQRQAFGPGQDEPFEAAMARTREAKT